MVPSLANQGQCALLAASTDLRRLSVRDPRNTQHVAFRTTLIPFAPTNRIVPCIFEGKLPRKVN